MEPVGNTASVFSTSERVEGLSFPCLAINISALWKNTNNWYKCSRVVQAAGTWYQSLVNVVPNAVLTVAVIHTDTPGSLLLVTRHVMMIIVELSSHFMFL